MRKIILLAIMMLSFTTHAAYACSDEKQQAINKQNVVAFYNEVINNKNFAAASAYLGSRYTQHNPTAADGPEGLKAFIQYLRDNYPKAHSDIKRVFASGNYVILQVHSVREPGTRGRAIFDLFKLEKGKIVEHWDAVQEIPEKSANVNTMF